MRQVLCEYWLLLLYRRLLHRDHRLRLYHHRRHQDVHRPFQDDAADVISG
jgi:hypothetical protein